MKLPHRLAALLVLPALAMPLLATRSLDRPKAGDAALAFSAPTWINHLGQAPTIENLRGQAVLIDFWATWCPPCVAAWPHLEALHRKYGPEGLVVLGLSDEDPKTVSDFVEKNGYTARVAAGSPSGDAWGVSGIPDTILIDPSGTIVFRGHPSELQDSLVAKTVKRARKPDPKAPLRYVPDFEPGAGTSEITAAASRGELARALSLAATAAEAGSAPARELKGALERHAAALMDQTWKLVERKEARRAMDTYTMFAKELAGTDFGREAAEKLKSLTADADFKRELEAEDALEKLERKVARLASARASEEYREFAEKYQGTRAGRLARKRGAARS
jgi:thiol-disulfide isomerase/thioredoxin